MKMNKLKTFLWKMGLKKEDVCPLCKGTLHEHYGEEPYEKLFTCDNKKCEFGKEEYLFGENNVF